jgi:DNA repair protein RecO (recombination protein O)
MQKKIQFTGIVLKNLDYQDNAQIIYVLTKDNLDSILVRGAKKIESKTRPLAQIITKINGLRTEREKFSTLTEGVVEKNYNQIKEDFVKTQAVMCIFEKIYNLYPNISVPDKLYDFLDNILSMMEITNYPKSLLLIFEVKFWYLLGINPNFSNCVNCGEEIDSGYLFVNSGGLLCPICAQGFECDLNIEDSKIVKYLYHIKMEKIDEKFLSLIDVFYERLTKKIDKYYEKHIDFYNKSKEIFYKLI